VTEIASALREYRHVLFDVYNEHDHPDGPISHAAALPDVDHVWVLSAGHACALTEPPASDRPLAQFLRHVVLRIPIDFPSLVQEVGGQKKDWANPEYQLGWQNLTPRQIDTSDAFRRLNLIRIYLAGRWSGPLGLVR